MPDDDDLEALLAAYLSPGPRDQNPEYADVEVIIPPAILEKLESKHRITAADVEDAIKGQPPAVVEATHDDPERRQFFRHTRYGHGLFVVGVWEPGAANPRRLRVITAFLPDDDDGYWKRQR